MFPVTNRHQTPADTAGIQSRTTTTQSIKRLALSILATAATYFLCSRPVFFITAGISLIINRHLAYRMSDALFRVFENTAFVPLQRQPSVEGTIHNGGSRARDPILPQRRRDRPEARHETGSTTDHGTVGLRAVTSISNRPLAREPVRTAQAPIPRSERWAEPLAVQHAPRQAPQASYVPEPLEQRRLLDAHGTVGLRAVTYTAPLRPSAEEAVRAAREPASSLERWAAPLSTEYTLRQAPQASHEPGPSTGFQPWPSPQRATSEVSREPQADPLAPPQSRAMQGAVGSRAAVTVPNLIPPPDVERQSWRDEEEHKENRRPAIPGHGIVGIGQGRR